MNSQLVLVRYLIPTIFIDTWIWFDTRYFCRKCNFVDIFRGYLKRLRHVHLLFFKKLFCYETLWGKRNPDFFLENLTFFRKSNFFSLENPDLFRKYTKFGGLSLNILLFENIRNPVFGHFPSFPASSFMPRVTYLQYLTQCVVKPGLYSVRRSTQTELRKRIYADTRVMAFILLRRSRRVCTRIVGVFILSICAIPTA